MAALLARAHRAFHHRVDDFQMRGIERQSQVHRPARGGDVGRETLVVFHVAGSQFAMRGMLALELQEQVARQFADGVDQHVEAAAVRHADHHFLHALAAGTLNQVIQQRNQAVAALQRKAFLPDIAGVQVFFQGFRGSDQFQYASLAIGGKLRPAPGGFPVAPESSVYGWYRGCAYTRCRYCRSRFP